MINKEKNHTYGHRFQKTNENNELLYFIYV